MYTLSEYQAHSFYCDSRPDGPNRIESGKTFLPGYYCENGKRQMTDLKTRQFNVNGIITELDLLHNNAVQCFDTVDYATGRTPGL